MNLKDGIAFKTADIVIQIALLIILGTTVGNLDGFFLLWIALAGWQLVSFIAHLFVSINYKKRSLRTLWFTTLLWTSVVSVLFIATFILSFFALFLEMFFLPVLGIFYLIISIGERKMMKNEYEQSQSIHAIL